LIHFLQLHTYKFGKGAEIDGMPVGVRVPGESRKMMRKWKSVDIGGF
jgi:hypothetical protein